MPTAEPAIASCSGLRHWLRRELLPLAVMLLLLGVARSSFANHYQVPSGSMQPTLMPGDRVVVDMHSYGLRVPFGNQVLVAGRSPARGEVVVFDSPANGERLIKRVVAVGGDEVRLLGGHLSVNSRSLAVAADEEQFGEVRARLDLRDGGGPDIAGLTVPAGQLLVLGDHRGNSLDGRYFGWVRADAVYGRAIGVYYRRGEGLQWTRL